MCCGTGLVLILFVCSLTLPFFPPLLYEWSNKPRFSFFVNIIFNPYFQTFQTYTQTIYLFTLLFPFLFSGVTRNGSSMRLQNNIIITHAKEHASNRIPQNS